MTDRRELLTFISVGMAAALAEASQASAQTPGKKLSVPRVIDIKNLDGALLNVSEVDRIKFRDLLAKQPFAKDSGNCGCNAVCRCNDNTNSCCENKCACHSKSGETRRIDLIRETDEYKNIINQLNPSQVKSFDELGSILLQIPALKPKASEPRLGVSDTSAPLKVGTFSQVDLEKLYSIRDLDGRRVSSAFLQRQIAPSK
jgi:hypothetical protein